MTPARYVFDAPVQALRAGDRVLRCPEPELTLATVLYVQSARGIRSGGGTPPAPFAPIAVVTAPRDLPPGRGVTLELEAPIVVGWGTRCLIERIEDAAEEYLVTGSAPLAVSSRFEVRATMVLELEHEAFERHVGPLIEGLVNAEFLERVQEHGELIDTYWYVDGRRVETPAEQSAREAADLFAGHTVRLRPAGQDAGETCPMCGRVITWTDHLPPGPRSEFVRCHRAGARRAAS